LQLADKNDLPHVIRIVRADVSDFRSPDLQLLVINGFDKPFQFGHHLVELLDRIVPLFAVEVGEGFVVVAAEFLLRLALELGQLPPVPEQQMIGQLSDGVVPAAILPAGLLCCKPFYGYVDGCEPVFLVMSGAQLLQQYAPQGRWLGVLRVGVKRQGQNYKRNDVFHTRLVLQHVVRGLDVRSTSWLARRFQRFPRRLGQVSGALPGRLMHVDGKIPEFSAGALRFL